MKTKLILLSLLLLGCGSFTWAQKLRGDGLKSAIIKYVMKSNDMETAMEEYRDDYGAKVCTKMMLLDEEIGYIINGGKNYMVNYSQKYYMKMPSIDNSINYNDLTPETIKENNIVATGTEEFLGRKCTVYTSEYKDRDMDIKTKAWVYKGIVLKILSESNGNTDSRIATSLEENPSIPASTFEVPAGFTQMKQ